MQAVTWSELNFTLPSTHFNTKRKHHSVRFSPATQVLITYLCTGHTVSVLLELTV